MPDLRAGQDSLSAKEKTEAQRGGRLYSLACLSNTIQHCPGVSGLGGGFHSHPAITHHPVEHKGYPQEILPCPSSLQETCRGRHVTLSSMPSLPPPTFQSHRSNKMSNSVASREYWCGLPPLSMVSRPPFSITASSLGLSAPLCTFLPGS